MHGKLRLADLRDINDLKICIIGLEIVKDQGEETWNEIDILNQIIQGHVSCFIGKGEDSLTCYVKEESNTKILWIWTAFSNHGDAISHYYDDIIQLAKDTGCTSIRWSSKRMGYMKKLQKLGGKIHQIEYSIDIP